MKNPPKNQTESNPFLYTNSNKRYHTIDYFFNQKFGSKACKVPIDGGFTCPNRDGTKGVGGCIFCSSQGSGEFAAGRHLSITEQIDRGIEMMHKKWQGAAIIPYFQAFTSTYAPLPVLAKMYDEALSHPVARGLCISTRADCLSDELVSHLKTLAKKHFLMLELGLQSVHDETADFIGRGHNFLEFLSGYEKVKDLFVCVHIINGLPHETHAMMVKTAKIVAKLAPSAIKIHLLHVLSDSRLAELYLSGNYTPLTLENYTKIVCDQLEILPPEIVIERVSGDGAPNKLLAPDWSRKKLVVQNEIDKELFNRASYQGIFATN